jgi:hypothetical protein
LNSKKKTVPLGTVFFYAKDGENKRNCLDKNKIWEESPMKKYLVFAMAMALGVSALKARTNSETVQLNSRELT